MIPEQDKQMILVMRRQGASCPEIARLLELSPNTVKSICRRNKTNAQLPQKSSTDGCRYCGAPLNQIPGVKKKRFCSDKCRYAWWNRQRSKRVYRLTCYQCGKVFASYGNKKRKYCGKECYLRSRYGEGLP